MGMGVAFGRWAMGRPTRMPDANAVIGLVLVDEFIEFCHLPFFAKQRRSAGRSERCHPRRIIASIFKTAQTAKQNWLGLFAAYIADYSAHVIASIRIGLSIVYCKV